MPESDKLKIYKQLEIRLYGELMKSCRRYSNHLNLISILGIIEIVKQELKELHKTDRAVMKRKTPSSKNESTDKT